VVIWVVVSLVVIIVILVVVVLSPFGQIGHWQQMHPDSRTSMQSIIGIFIRWYLILG
jgi:hypothetical protein